MDTIKKITLTDHSSAVAYFISKLDIEMLNDILDENLKYQDFKKQKFLSKLKAVFLEFQILGDTYLEIYDGKCKECNKCDIGKSFVGNVSKAYIDLIIKSDQGRVIDIFECSSFQNESVNIVKKFRQYLDNDNPF